MSASLLAAASVCSLLTSAEIARVQGEPPLRTKATAPAGELHAAQCFYELKTFTRSVSLEVARGEGLAAFWKKTFHAQREREAAEVAKGEAGEPEEIPERVRGVGDEAYWSGSARLGGLYVLRKGAMLRLSIGGAEPKETKLRKLRSLALRALRRL